METFRGSTKKVVFLAPPPSDVDIKKCYTRLSEPADCVSRVTRHWSSMADVESSLATTMGGVFVDSRPWFCNAQGLCPTSIGNTPTKMDLVHMTPEYARKLVPALDEELVRLKLLPRPRITAR